MADYKSLPSKPEDDGHPVPSRAGGSFKGEGVVQPRTEGRGLKPKPPAQTDEPVAPPRRRGSVKGEGAGPRPRPSSRQKAKPPATDEGAAGKGGGEYPRNDIGDQVPRRRSRTATGDSGRYVRLRVHVEDGKMSIVDSHLVESTLAMPSTLHGEYAYEVTDGVRVFHADSIPDLGVVRAFANPKGDQEQLRHHRYRASTYDFNVRVPADELTEDRLSDIAVVLYRVKEPVPPRAFARDQPLGAQFERELREVNRVSGIPYDVLPGPLRRRPSLKS